MSNRKRHRGKAEGSAAIDAPLNCGLNSDVVCAHHVDMRLPAK